MIVRTVLWAAEGAETFTHKDANRLWEAVGSRLDIRTAATVGTVFAIVAVVDIHLSTEQQLQPMKNNIVQLKKALSSIQQDLNPEAYGGWLQQGHQLKGKPGSHLVYQNVLF